MKQYGIFIEPQAELKDYLERKKREVREKFGQQIYVDHPAHSTLFNAAMNEEKNWIDLLNQVQQSPLQLSCRDFRVFYQDPLCKGCDTLTLELQGKNLHELQMRIAALLQAHTDITPQDFGNKEMQQSWNDYGFPFIGRHWIPHMTIASLNQQQCGDYLQRTLQESIDFSFLCSSISVWRIDGENHKKIKKVQLK